MNRGWLYRCIKMKKLCLAAIFILCSLTVYSQKENKLKELNFEDVPLAEVLKKIEQLFHTSVMFVYDEVEGYFITTRLQVATVDEAVKQSCTINHSTIRKEKTLFRCRKCNIRLRN